MALFYKFSLTFYLIQTGTDLHTYETDLSQFPQNVGPKMFQNVLKQIQKL